MRLMFNGFTEAVGGNKGGWEVCVDKGERLYGTTLAKDLWTSQERQATYARM